MWTNKSLLLQNYPIHGEVFLAPAIEDKRLFDDSMILSLDNDIVHGEVAIVRHRLGKNETTRDKWEEGKRKESKWEENKRSHHGLDLVS